MEGNNAHQISSEDLRIMLHQIQQTTMLLAERLETNQAPSPVRLTPNPSTATSSTNQTTATRPNFQPPPSPMSPLPSSSYNNCPLTFSNLAHPTNLAPSTHQQALERYSPYHTSFQGSRGDTVQADLARLFRRNSTMTRGFRGSQDRSKKMVPWNHVFVCLPEPGVDRVPKTEEANFYKSCGIGKKIVTFLDNQGGHTYLTERLYDSFPPLKEAGGFVLATGDRSKSLKEIQIPPSGYSIPFLRHHEHVKRAPLYIIPLQKELTLIPPVMETSHVMQNCLGCGVDFLLCDLPKHLETCQKNDQDIPTDDSLQASNTAEVQVNVGSGVPTEDEDDDDLAVAIYESIQASHTGEVSCGGGSEVQSEDFVMWSNYDDLEREEMAPVTEVAVLVTEEPELDVTAILKNMSSQLVPGPPPQSNSIMVMRETILDSAFRAFRRQRFSPTHRLDVTFVDCDGTGEGAVDDGGPSREFLRLLVVAIRDSKYFSGPEDSKNLSLVSQGVENGDYTLLGKMVSVALVHGGIRPRFFSSRFYTALGCRPTPPVNLDEVDDYDLKEKLQKILDAETLAETQDAVMEASGALSMLGCTCLIQNLDQKRVFIEDVARAYVEGRIKVAKEQFIDGLQTLGVANAIENHHEAIKTIFVGGLKMVSLQDMQKLFSVQLSLPGSNKRRLENQTTIFWNDWLLEVDEGTRPVTLGQILTFASGMDNIPPLGFNTSPTIEFLHHEDGNNRIFPEANTCGVVLRLPIHPTYALFVQYMESGILQSPTFGLI